MALAAVGNMEHNGQQFFFKEQQLSVDFSVAIMQSPKGRSIDFSVAISLRFHLGPSQTVPASPTQQDLLLQTSWVVVNMSKEGNLMEHKSLMFEDALVLGK
ncbi:hypothetical protein F2P56_025041 [Juglans regia]|uniref:Uncharacterized protein LOC108999805 isoform X5 n=2 Tax=Juglans regia TaxID=51240 RepID=A0A2I4FKT2_JUGRE|nr:uncharacterized protein LOC108999805 isoform X5 [Juglans regia]KAF5455469.1 hypothetical protein F2P56_025041 [Juglans regia]